MRSALDFFFSLQVSRTDSGLSDGRGEGEGGRGEGEGGGAGRTKF